MKSRAFLVKEKKPLIKEQRSKQYVFLSSFRRLPSDPKIKMMKVSVYLHFDKHIDLCL